MGDLKTVIHTLDVDWQVPNYLCVSSPSTLLYIDVSNEMSEFNDHDYFFEVNLLDCSGSETKPVQGKNVIKTQQFAVIDMCIAHSGDKEILVVVDGSDDGIYGYNTATDELEWKIEGGTKEMSPGGVATDGCGHLYFSDHHTHCIRMFSVRDGAYMGDILKGTGLGKPWWITWCEAALSLLVTLHENDARCYSFIKIKLNF